MRWKICKFHESAEIVRSYVEHDVTRVLEQIEWSHRVTIYVPRREIVLLVTQFLRGNGSYGTRGKSCLCSSSENQVVAEE